MRKQIAVAFTGALVVDALKRDLGRLPQTLSPGDQPRLKRADLDTARVVRGWYDPERDCFAVVLESETADWWETGAGMQLPRVFLR